jgi:sulfatase modifying factor 1
LTRRRAGPPLARRPDPPSIARIVHRLAAFGAAAVALAACVYRPNVPDGVTRCASARECPAGYGCYPTGGEAMACCRAPHCGRIISTSAAVDAAAGPPPDAEVTPPPEPADAATAADVAPPDTAPAAPLSCRQGRPGPALLLAARDPFPYCIDATEVTNAHYAAFVAATGRGTAVQGQSAVCAWNTSFLPDPKGGPWPVAGSEHRPVVNVDWCDAAAFCRWAGKRLCGRIGGGKLVSTTEATDLAAGEWVNACTGGSDDRDYPYGPAYQAHLCNTDAPMEDGKYIEDVAHRPRCQGAIPGVYDLGGNVEEWIDACDADTGADDLCGSAGPAAYTGDLVPADFTCASSIYGSPRAHPFKLRGFRCCADP